MRTLSEYDLAEDDSILKEDEYWVTVDKTGKVVVGRDYGWIVGSKIKKRLLTLDLLEGDTVRKIKLGFVD